MTTPAGPEHAAEPVIAVRTAVTTEPRLIIEAVDVTDDILTRAEAIYDGWFANSEGGRVSDWENFMYRLEGEDEDFGGSMMSAAIRKIQRHIRAYAKL